MTTIDLAAPPSPLLEPYHLKGLRLPNRVVMAPMTRARATRDGLPTASAATYYAQRASAGLIVTEGIQPSLQGQSNPNTPGLHTDEQVAAWRTVTHAVHANGGRIFAQLMHAGRVGHPANVGFVPVAPSAVQLATELYTAEGPLPAPVPRELTTVEVRGEVAVFAEAARRAIDAGFDGVELHGANGYLIQQFLSSNVNRRTDEYGGDIAGRIRFAVEVAEACVEAIGADRVAIRLSPGTDIWDVVEDDVPALYEALLSRLDSLDLAYVHTLATHDDELFGRLRTTWNGTFIVNPSPVIVGEQADRAAGEHWLAQGADLVAFGRAYLANPDLVERFRIGAPLRHAGAGTYYGGGDVGYIDDLGHRHARHDGGTSRARPPPWSGPGDERRRPPCAGSAGCRFGRSCATRGCGRARPAGGSPERSMRARRRSPVGPVQHRSAGLDSGDGAADPGRHPCVVGCTWRCGTLTPVGRLTA